MTYLLFSFMDYYPSGGVDDLDGHFQSAEEAMNAWTNDQNKNVYAQVYCVETRTKVWEAEFVCHEKDGRKVCEWRKVDETKPKEI